MKYYMAALLALTISLVGCIESVHTPAGAVRVEPAIAYYPAVVHGVRYRVYYWWYPRRGWVFHKIIVRD